MKSEAGMLQGMINSLLLHLSEKAKNKREVASALASAAGVALAAAAFI